MNVRDYNVDFKFGNQGNIVYCIYDIEPPARKMTKALLVYHADTMITEVLYDGRGVIATQNKFIVGVSRETYLQLVQPAPLGEFRRAKIQQKKKEQSCWHIVYTDEQMALEFEKQLTAMKIAVIKPELSHQEDNWVSAGVFMRNNEYIIRIDQAGKDKLDASRICFQDFPSFQQLKGIEERCELLLRYFVLQVINPCMNMKSASLSAAYEILQQEWISNRKKIEIIDEKVSIRANSTLLTALRGEDGQKFQKLYSEFQLKKKADDIINNMDAVSLNMDACITPYAQAIIDQCQQTIKEMDEKCNQVAKEVKSLQAQHSLLLTMTQTQQAQYYQLLTMVLPAALSSQHHPSQVVDHVTMFAQHDKQRTHVQKTEPALNDDIANATRGFRHG